MTVYTSMAKVKRDRRKTVARVGWDIGVVLIALIEGAILFGIVDYVISTDYTWLYQ